MQFSTQVNFTCRYGKSIGSSISGLIYQLKNEVNKLGEDKRKLYRDSLDEIIKTDPILCDWLYYSDYDKFLSEFKNYVMIIDNDEFNVILGSTVCLGQVMDNFWLESNDPRLKTDYDYEKVLEKYIKQIEKNGYVYKENDNDIQFKILLKNIDYRTRNKDLYTEYFNMSQQLKHARIDDLLQMRTREEWEIVYSLRFLYKNVVNILLDKKISRDDMFQYNKTEGFSFDLDV